MSEPYLIRKHGLWYGRNSSGYVAAVYAADTYDEELARRVAKTDPRFIEAVPLRNHVKELLCARREIDEKLALFGPLPHPPEVAFAVSVVDTGVNWKEASEVERAWKIVKRYFGRTE